MKTRRFLNWMNQNDLWFLVGIGCLFFVVVLSGASLLAAIAWKGSCVEASIYNRRHNTSYTRSDFFWAGEQINSQVITIEGNR